ncbi:MAG: hypothetical protein ABJB55_07765 [Actinomycetota bacterium]
MPEPAPKHARTRSIERSRMIFGAVGLAIAAVLVWGFLHFMGNAGNEIASDQQHVVAQIGNTQDIQAQLTGSQAIQAVQMLYSQDASFDAVTPQSMRAFEPAFTYATAASTGPNAVSVSSSSTGVGLAVLSASGTCLYAHVSPAGTTYGTGSSCTGAAALDASDPAWPSAAT